MGRRAMRLLHSRIVDGPADPELLVLPVSVKTRESTGVHLRVVGAPREGRP
jgi:GntR family transcriptional regulator, arabinose operon transcriptional repressor